MFKKLKKLYFTNILTDHLICEWTIDSLKKICQEYHTRIDNLENEKYDFEYLVRGKDYQVHIATAKSADQQIEKYFSLTQKALFLIFVDIFFKKNH